MRKFLLLLLFVIITISCTSGPAPSKIEYNARRVIIFDDSLPKEESVALNFQDGIKVTSFNGIPVNWPQKTLVYVPPGPIVLTFDADFSNASSISKGKDWPFIWEFNAGDKFFLKGWIRYEDSTNKPVVMVIEPGKNYDLRTVPAFYIPLRDPKQQAIILN